MLGPARFRFLGQEGELREPADWNDPAQTKLWLYNLHYFDDLNARDSEARRDWHQSLIRRWVAENLPGFGNGWEPYPTSLRIVNWIKWALRGNTLEQEAVQSLAVQARWLRRNLEYHLLGNHLLANAKALVFAGAFFEGSEADEWDRKGRQLLERELDEQVLSDGGHFELSPMYHLIILEDLLDLINLEQLLSRAVPRQWYDTAQRMLRWAAVMRHPDGQVPFFNDAAMDVAPPPVQLDTYAKQLGLTVTSSANDSAFLSESGYARVSRGLAMLFVDVAKVGPDYLPGHAHADSLSFELSLAGRRILVNAGTSTYEPDNLRAWQRGTSAHNTMRINWVDSSEMWAAFRVARRAAVSVQEVRLEGSEAAITAFHDGYRRLAGAPVHQRAYRLTKSALVVQDQVTGGGEHDIETFLHLHPEIRAEVVGVKDIELRLSETNELVSTLTFHGAGAVDVQEGWWYPEFGRAIANQRCVLTQFRVTLPACSGFTIDWSSTALSH